MKDKIEALLFTGIRANIELAIELAKGQDILLDEYLEIASLINPKSEEPEEQLYIFWFFDKLCELSCGRQNSKPHVLKIR